MWCMLVPVLLVVVVVSSSSNRRVWPLSVWESCQLVQIYESSHASRATSAHDRRESWGLGFRFSGSSHTEDDGWPHHCANRLDTGCSPLCDQHILLSVCVCTASNCYAKK